MVGDVDATKTLCGEHRRHHVAFAHRLTELKKEATAAEAVTAAADRKAAAVEADVATADEYNAGIRKQVATAEAGKWRDCIFIRHHMTSFVLLRVVLYYEYNTGIRKQVAAAEASRWRYCFVLFRVVS
jgi:hypothetical protein